MSAALATHPDLSSTSNGTHPEISLGSLTSGFSTPAKHLRVPSTSSRSTAPSSLPIATPSPPTGTGTSVFSRRGLGFSRLNAVSREGDVDVDEGGGGEDGSGAGGGAGGVGGDLLDTPAVEKKRYAEDVETPIRGAKRGVRSSVAGNKGVTLTLRDQEKHIDNLKKENFNIKLRVHFLEERLAQLAPDQIDAALKQNINLKIEVQQRNMELKKLRKLVLQLERELEQQQNQQRGGAGSRDRERELEEKLEEREREIRELRRARGAHGGGENDDVMRELEMQNAHLEEELEGARELLQDNMEEIERLKDLMERRDDSLNESSTGEGNRARLMRRINELEEEVDELRHRLGDSAEAIAQREEDKEELMDVIDSLKLEIEDLRRKREAESAERSQSRALILEEREEREAVEDDLNAMRDRVAALLIELQQKEDEVDQKNKEIDELVAEHKRIVEVVEDEWRGEVEEARMQVEELKDVLAERETEVRELRLNMSEFEARNNDLRNEFEAALNDLEAQAEAKDTEIEGLRTTIDKLGEDIYMLEDENDKIKEEAERIRDDDAVERERLEALSAALKEKLAQVRAELQETTEVYESCHRELHSHRLRQQELQQQVEDLADELDRAQKDHTREIEALERKHDDDIRKSTRALEAKESALQSALNDLTRAQALLAQREADVQDVQRALEGLEEESKRRGEVDTTARFSLQLEVDRLKRDLERVEDELARARKEIDDRENKNREKDSMVDKLHGENRELAAQLASQTQARLNLSEKLDLVQTGLKKAEGEVEGYKSRVAELEQRLSKDQRSLLNAENQYRDQLTERNTLLLTIYQYMDKILGVDKTPKKGNAGETKPFTNFSVFHDNLITRLKALSQIQLDFDKRCKEVEAKYMEKLTEIRKQLDVRWKQIDKFEASVKTYADTKAAWRRKFAVKEGELEALKTTNNELTQQISSLKRLNGPDATAAEVRSLTTRATNAERRLNNAQNQLLATEEKIAAMNQRSMAADNKWEARVKEYESRLRAAEERVKRERQGSKERVLELENRIKSLQQQLERAQKHSQQLAGVVEANKAAGSAS